MISLVPERGSEMVYFLDDRLLLDLRLLRRRFLDFSPPSADCNLATISSNLSNLSSASEEAVATVSSNVVNLSSISFMFFA